MRLCMSFTVPFLFQGGLPGVGGEEHPEKGDGGDQGAE